MSFNRLVIIGAGGHGKVIADIAIKMGYNNIVFADDSTFYSFYSNSNCTPIGRIPC